MQTGNKTVDEISQLNFQGNIIPLSWYHNIKTPSGHPDTIAITLLSDIVYWYRAAEIRDENTGKLLGYRKRFKADQLQRTSRAYAQMFGFSLRQVQDALQRLEQAGIIKRSLRNITTPEGLAISNVQFIDLNPEVIRQITYNTHSNSVKGKGSSEKTHNPLRESAEPPTPNVTPCTETTTLDYNKENRERAANAAPHFKDSSFEIAATDQEQKPESHTGRKKQIKIEPVQADSPELLAFRVRLKAHRESLLGSPGDALYGIEENRGIKALFEQLTLGTITEADCKECFNHKVQNWIDRNRSGKPPNWRYVAEDIDTHIKTRTMTQRKGFQTQANLNSPGRGLVL